MRLAALRIAGFRGVKEEISLLCPGAFAVITGRNGTGKSTICDAIEYALTGSLRRSLGQKEKGESFLDYLWWRGPGKPSSREVSLTLISDEGEEWVVTRTPEGEECYQTTSEGRQVANLEELLCDLESAPVRTLEALCRTSILRDEDITRLSLEMGETDRYQFVRDAIGTVDFSPHEERAKKALEQLEGRAKRFENGYLRARSLVEEVTSRLSEARSEARVSSGTANPEATLRELLEDESSDIAPLLHKAGESVAQLRVQTDNLLVVQRRQGELARRQQELQTAEHLARIKGLEREIEQFVAQLKDAEAAVTTAEQMKREANEQQPRLALLADLHQSGRELGLEDGHCPLCGSEIAEDAFADHLRMIRRRLEEGAKASMEAAHRRAGAVRQRDQLRDQRERRQRELQELMRTAEVLEKAASELRDEALRNGLAPTSGELTQEELAKHIETNRNTMARVQRAMADVEVSRAYERVAKLARDLQAKKTEANSLQDAVQQARDAQQYAKKGYDIIRRVQGEIIDEHLAELEPLFLELYQRLRPHPGWMEIRYRLRGDVRRMLSLEIGKGLKPAFIFSSGQRRAAGLAFLLAAYLARRWCRLETLILDDPVQHIDDYRALHLAETLGAIRRMGRQIICAVEDPALAKLLCRRLCRGDDGDGVLVEMDYQPDRGVYVDSIQRIAPFSRHVVVSA